MFNRSERTVEIEAKNGTFRVRLGRPGETPLSFTLTAAEAGELAAKLARGQTRDCEACGIPIAFAVGPQGRYIPLDMAAPCYELYLGAEGERRCREAPHVHVSHFKTCSDPGRFSRRQPAPAEAPP